MTKAVLPEENIKLQASISSKEDAIKTAGQVLVDGGYTDASYVEKMFEREEISSTFMGNFVAIPHGTDDAKKHVHHSGISIIQVPEGVDFGGGNIVKLVFGIAGKGDEHLEMLSKIAIICSEEENIERMVQASSKEELLAIFDEVSE
ncbi:PTS sugar transporter subunit IIA [Paenalkalicoccus suaedae]|uniref:Mannitol-specific phosphotransferase enzyme IIA component n=1 Tax=Paenalkalicoccus suaedae TaxID=2592382 RepID=A0A859FAM1_9BACI|nr:PTS sugar transporter subunit IIA [Paenalkalicoccus suaedae]QKS69838.1 PTS sugar transporter subunit IIA [Paenalkalicoccus suaedae]